MYRELGMNIKTSGVYAIRIGDCNRRKYIGSSANMESRRYNHESLLRHNKHTNKLLQEEYNKNPQSFRFEVLTYCDVDELYENEELYIRLHNSSAERLRVLNLQNVLNTTRKVRTKSEQEKFVETLRLANLGIKNPNSKLSEQNVKEILYLRNKTKMKARDIAEIYELSTNYIYKIGKTAQTHIAEEIKPIWL